MTETSTALQVRHLSGVEKAATLLIMLGDEGSSDLVRRLGEEEIEKVGRVVTNLKSITSDQAEAVLEEYVHMTLMRRYMLRGGTEYARRMLTAALGHEAAERLMMRFSSTLASSEDALQHIESADPRQLARLLEGEHPQAVALVLSRMPPTRAATVLGGFSASLRSDIALRLTSLDQISPEIVKRITDVIGQRLKDFGEASTEKYGGLRAVAELLNSLDATAADETLAEMELVDANAAESIRNLMFVFDDLVKLDQGAIKELIGRVDRKVLTIALKGTTDQLKQKICKSMSQRGAEMLMEDLGATGPVRIKEVEAAQQQVIAVVRQLEKEGAISTSGEQYVV
jgi:flagellar motor switch protein FliG